MFCPRTATRNGVSAARHSRKSLADQGSEKTARSIAATAATSAGWAGRIRQGAAMASLPFRLGLGRPTIHWLGREGVIELARRAGSSNERQQRGGIRQQAVQRHRLRAPPPVAIARTPPQPSAILDS